MDTRPGSLAAVGQSDACGAQSKAGARVMARPRSAEARSSSPETGELRAETLQMGYSLRKLPMELEGTDEKARAHLAGLEGMSFPAAFAFAVAQWQIPAQQALVACLWAWLENQVMAAVKWVPLGQTERDQERCPSLDVCPFMPSLSKYCETLSASG